MLPQHPPHRSHPSADPKPWSEGRFKQKASLCFHLHAIPAVGRGQEHHPHPTTHTAPLPPPQKPKGLSRLSPPHGGSSPLCCWCGPLGSPWYQLLARQGTREKPLNIPICSQLSLIAPTTPILIHPHPGTQLWISFSSILTQALSDLDISVLVKCGQPDPEERFDSVL